MTTKVTFKVDSGVQLGIGERLGLILWGEFGRLQEVVLTATGKLHFTSPIALTTLDRVEYSYVVLSDSHAAVRLRTRALAKAGAPLRAGQSAPLTSYPRNPFQTSSSSRWARRGTAPSSPRAWRCWCRTL